MQRASEVRDERSGERNECHSGFFFGETTDNEFFFKSTRLRVFIDYGQQTTVNGLWV